MVPPAYFMTNAAEMAQSSLASRKRGRSDGDEESRDFTPLSKRINNLHINNGNYSNHSTSLHKEGHPDSPARRVSCDAHSNEEERTSGGVMEIQQQPTYRPDLNHSDNPYYYEPNKLLYYLYIERLQRSGQSFE